MRTTYQLSQRLAGMTIRNTIITSNAILALEAFLSQARSFSCDLILEKLNELGFGIRCWVSDIMVAKYAHELVDSKGGCIELGVEI